MEFLVSEGISEGTLPFSLKIFDKKTRNQRFSVRRTSVSSVSLSQSVNSQSVSQSVSQLSVNDSLAFCLIFIIVSCPDACANTLAF